MAKIARKVAKKTAKKAAKVAKKAKNKEFFVVLREPNTMNAQPWSPSGDFHIESSVQKTVDETESCRCCGIDGPSVVYKLVPVAKVTEAKPVVTKI